MSLQSLWSTAFAFIWPESKVIWVLGIGVYIICSLYLMAEAVRLGKLAPRYYFLGMTGSYGNWALFGALGVVSSWLL